MKFNLICSHHQSNMAMFALKPFLLFCLHLLTASSVYASTRSSIFISGPRIAVEYSKLQLSCIVSREYKNGPFLWYFSSGTSDDQQLLSPNTNGPIRLYPNGTVLTIRSVSPTHAGSYRCCVEDTVCASMNLFVLSANDESSSLRTVHDRSDDLLDVSSDGTFSLAIYFAPFPGEVYIERDASIPFCEHFRNRSGVGCNVTRSSTDVSYNVYNATMMDSAQFFVKILFNQRLEKTRLHILIRGKPTIRMNDYDVVSQTDHNHIGLHCEGYAYPTPNFTFTYTPCPATVMDLLANINRSSCEKPVIIPRHLERLSPFNYTTTVEAVIPEWPFHLPGIVSCEASSGEGTASIETLLFVRNSRDPTTFRVVSPTDVVLYDDTVNMTCQADVYNHTDRFTVHHGGKTYDLIGQRFGYAWTVSLLTHITNDSQNEASCEVHHKNGSVLVRSLNLSIRYPSKPHVVSGNDTVNATIAFGEEMRLECDIEGTPTPQIVWFKNDVHLSHARGHFISVSLEPAERQATYKCHGKSRQGKVTKTWHIRLEDTTNWLLISGAGAAGLFAVVVIGAVVWSVEAVRQLVHRQTALEAQLNEIDEK